MFFFTNTLFYTKKEGNTIVFPPPIKYILPHDKDRLSEPFLIVPVIPAMPF